MKIRQLIRISVGYCDLWNRTYFLMQFTFVLGTQAMANPLFVKYFQTAPPFHFTLLGNFTKLIRLASTLLVYCSALDFRNISGSVHKNKKKMNWTIIMLVRDTAPDLSHQTSEDAQHGYVQVCLKYKRSFYLNISYMTVIIQL